MKDCGNVSHYSNTRKIKYGPLAGHNTTVHYPQISGLFNGLYYSLARNGENRGSVHCFWYSNGLLRGKVSFSDVLVMILAVNIALSVHLN